MYGWLDARLGWRTDETMVVKEAGGGPLSEKSRGHKGSIVRIPYPRCCHTVSLDRRCG